ncbi:helix-turn-helix domain-containing protein [Rhodococcus aetherivorans]|uniref:helix-turn-helix transcriptional regulator n=1 Tax=Rhodococcus aetherivorans TaxID=191292 RepID=UPI0009DB8CCB|nr:helix-turn-helix domain-containing protein [Rhodococcus aetherivorans]
MPEVVDLPRTKELLSTKEVSREWGISEGTLRWWRHADEGPASFKLGKRVVYRRSAVEAWVSGQEVASTRGGAA